METVQQKSTGISIASQLDEIGSKVTNRALKTQSASSVASSRRSNRDRHLVPILEEECRSIRTQSSTVSSSVISVHSSKFDKIQSSSDESCTTAVTEVAKLSIHGEEGEPLKTPTKRTTSTLQTKGTPVGDSSIHIHSAFEPHTLNRCWTISDFKRIVAIPDMLKSLSLDFPDSTPKISFIVKQSKDGILVLKPRIDRRDLKTHAKDYVRYGFAVGPHRSLETDFSLESRTMQVKHLNKSRLQILEIKVLQNAYLVDGCLNLIIRFTTLKPISSTVHNSTLALACYSSSQQLVHSCTEFVQEAKIPHSDQHFGSGDYRLLNTSNNTNTRRRNSSASVSSELTHRNESQKKKQRDADADTECSFPVRQTEKLQSMEAGAIGNSYGWITGSGRKGCDIDFVPLGKCWNRDNLHPVNPDQFPIEIDPTQTENPVPRALSSSKVKFQAKDMGWNWVQAKDMGWNWDVSTIRSQEIRHID